MLGNARYAAVSPLEDVGPFVVGLLVGLAVCFDVGSFVVGLLVGDDAVGSFAVGLLADPVTCARYGA